MGSALRAGDQTRREPPARRQQYPADQSDQPDTPVVGNSPTTTVAALVVLSTTGVIRFAPLVPTKTIPLTAIGTPARRYPG